MHFVYICYSEAADRYYVGETENLERRIAQHRSGAFKGSSTSLASDWVARYYFTLPDRRQARLAETFIKKMKSRRVLEALINDQEYRRGFIEYVQRKLHITLKD